MKKVLIFVAVALVAFACDIKKVDNCNIPCDTPQIHEGCNHDIIPSKPDSVQFLMCDPTITMEELEAMQRDTTIVCTDPNVDTSITITIEHNFTQEDIDQLSTTHCTH